MIVLRSVAVRGLGYQRPFPGAGIVVNVAADTVKARWPLRGRLRRAWTAPTASHERPASIEKGPLCVATSKAGAPRPTQSQDCLLMRKPDVAQRKWVAPCRWGAIHLEYVRSRPTSSV